ncbi:MAG: sigma-70 family RNA polymerase sigma factor [Actinobacteria bacterium]|nr:sigma-70 family RNA polymerase sigma factor [Actinomycetota bacterium]
MRTHDSVAAGAVTAADVPDKRLLAFEQFYALEFERIYCAAYAYLGRKDAALDATQEAFTRAYARWKRLAKEPWVSGWVMTTALNLCRRDARGRGHVHPPTDGAAHQPSDDRVDVMAALRGLAPRQRTAALLFYFGDLPVAVVAELMGISEGTVKSHLARSREGMRERLSVSDAEGD